MISSGMSIRILAIGAALATTSGLGGALAAEHSLRFFGNGVAAPDQDRVKILLDAPHRPVDVGASDFTIEWWMKARLDDNGSGACFFGPDNWIYGNILLDRDVFGVGDWGDWGVSLAGGVIAFGVAEASIGVGICGASMVADGDWHHVAVTRRASDGRLQIYVDGLLDGQVANGPTGNISYRDGRVAGHPNEPYLVIGAEKHDAGAAYPSYNGWLDELRVSVVVRYENDFTPPRSPFLPDASTAALYHFDEGGGSLLGDSSGAVGGPSDGVVSYGGTPRGPVWSTDSPMTPKEIFADGFESGRFSGWSATVP